MAHASTETSSTRSLPAPPREVLLDLVRAAASGAGEQLGGMVNRLATVLLDMTTAGNDAQLVYRRTRAGNLLKSNSYAFIHLAGQALERALEQAGAELVPARAPTAGLDDLSLVPLEVMDTRVAFGALCRPFEIAHSEVLASLCVRLGLLLGREVLRPNQNPLRPEVFLTAVHEAWCEFEPDAGSHELLLPLLRPDLFLDLGELLEAADKTLRAHGKQARERFHIRKTDDTAAARARRSGMDAALAQQLRKLLGDAEGEPAAPLVPELPHMPQGSGWRPSAAAGFAMAAPADAGAGGTTEQPAAPAGQPFARVAPQAGPGQGVLAPAGVAPAGVVAPGAAPAGVPLFMVAGQGSAAAPGLAAAVPGGPATIGAAGAVPAAGFVAPVAGAAASAQVLVAAGLSGQPGAPQAHAGNLLDLLAAIELAAPGTPAPAAMAGASAGTGAAPHQVFYLPRLKQSLPQGSLSRGEENTLDLLSRIFETVLLDESIPPETRELIRFLQVPVLKAALLDQSFFFEEMHPARRMIDLLSRMGWEQRQAQDDPVVQAMRRGVDRIGREPGAEPQAFAAAVAEVEAELAAEERAAEAAIAQPIARATKIEKQTVAARSARRAVEQRLGDGALVAVVSQFLERRWVDVLTFAHLIDEERPGAVDNATRAMDDLVWTVKPKATQEQRKALIAKLPPLLTTLNKWLDAIKWQDADRLQFFAELAECHLQIVRAPLELSPERQLELAVEAAQQDALRRIAQEQAAAAQDEPADQDDASSQVDDLERGMRLEFAEPDGSVRKVKLAWVSPRRTLFIFSTGPRQEAFSLPAEKLVEAFRSGSVTLVAMEGVVGRVLTEAMREAVNDPAPLSALA
ncbi:DUF1631 family protein [Massilia sp.]|uniref:DUF1631 family protein n=1 Tax=Massilia sp. TaxID=1882437 RepID=UPI0028B0439E|nr:DUF1631 family protein [Massilia sp.]